MIHLRVRYKPEGLERYGESLLTLVPDKEITYGMEGAFNWKGVFIVNGVNREIVIPQSSIDDDPKEDDIDFNGIPIIESKSEVIQKIERFLNDKLR